MKWEDKDILVNTFGEQDFDIVPEKDGAGENFVSASVNMLQVDGVGRFPANYRLTFSPANPDKTKRGVLTGTDTLFSFG